MVKFNARSLCISRPTAILWIFGVQMLLFATLTETAKGHAVQRKREIIEIDNLPYANDTIAESGANADESLLPIDAEDAEDIPIAKHVIENINNSTNNSRNVTIKTTTDVNNVIEQEFDGHHSHSNKTDAPNTVLVSSNSTTSKDDSDDTKPSFTKDSSHVSHGSIENR